MAKKKIVKKKTSKKNAKKKAAKKLAKKTKSLRTFTPPTSCCAGGCQAECGAAPCDSCPNLIDFNTSSFSLVRSKSINFHGHTSDIDTIQIHDDKVKINVIDGPNTIKQYDLCQLKDLCTLAGTLAEMTK